MPAFERCVELIREFGFTALEAEIYVYLLQESPATGYKIAKGIGRSFTNVYKAISALRSKGAILVDEGSNRLSRAHLDSAGRWPRIPGRLQPAHRAPSGRSKHALRGSIVGIDHPVSALRSPASRAFSCSTGLGNLDRTRHEPLPCCVLRGLRE